MIMEPQLLYPADVAVEQSPGTLIPFVTMRSGGVPPGGLRDLLFEKTMEAVDCLLELEAANARDRGIAVKLLETLIGVTPTGIGARLELISLKRDIFNDRVPQKPLSDEARQRLSPKECAVLEEWTAVRMRRHRAEIEAKETFASESRQKSAALRRLCQRRHFRIALAQASPALSDDLDRAGNLPTRFSAGQTSRIERSLIRYYTRSAIKLSPFSSFMRTRVVRLSSAWSPLPAMLPQRSALRRSVRINRAIVAHFAQKMAEHPEIRESIPIFLNGAIAQHGDRLHILRLRRDMSQASRLRIPIESMARLRYSPALGRILDYFSSRAIKGVHLAQLVEDFAVEFGSAEAASGFIQKLIDIGLLLRKIPLPQDDSSAVTALADAAATLPMPNGRLRAVTAEFDRLRDLELQLENASAAQQPGTLAALADAVQSTHRALDDARAPDWTSRLVSEEVVDEPAAEMALPERWSPALDDMRNFLETYGPLLDVNSSLRASIRHHLINEFGGGPVAFLKFVAGYRAALPVVGQAGQDIAILRNPFLIDMLAALEGMRSELGEVITAPAPLEEIDLRDVAVQRRWAERVSRLGMPRPAGGASLVTCFVQPCFDRDGSAALVLNQMDAGPCRTLLRAVSAMSDTRAKNEMVTEIARSISTIWREAQPCTIYSTFDYELNACPIVTRLVLDYEGDAEDRERSIRMGDLSIGVTADGNVELTAGRTPVVVVHFGSVASAFQPLCTGLLLGIARSEPILFRPFDPRHWNAEVPSSWPEIASFPRLVFGRCIVRRRGWLVKTSALPRRSPMEHPASYILRVRRWQREAGMPDEVFLRARSLGERNKGEDATSRSSTLPHKPQYVDFRNYLLVESMNELFKDVLTAAYFEEAQPSLNDWRAMGFIRALEFAVDERIGPGSAF